MWLILSVIVVWPVMHGATHRLYRPVCALPLGHSCPRKLIDNFSRLLFYKVTLIPYATKKDVLNIERNIFKGQLHQYI